MPFVRFWNRLKRLGERREAELKAEEERWMLGQWMQARTLYHGLTLYSEMPPTKAQHEGKEKPDWNRIDKARKQREEHDERWANALADPKHFGKFMGMPQILGEPPEPEKPEDRKARYKRISQEAQANVVDLLERMTQKRGA